MVGGASSHLDDMLVLNFLIHGTRSQKVPQTDTTLASSMLNPVNRLESWREHVVQMGMSPTNQRNLPILHDKILL